MSNQLNPNHLNHGQMLVLRNGHAGFVAIQPSYLTRLNYHDGMFLRAAELKQEQDYLRQLTALSNQAGGAGIVHGFDCTMRDGQLDVGPGLAIDPQGRVLRLPQSTTVGIDDLIAQSQESSSPAAAAEMAASSAFTLCELRGADPPAPFPSPNNLYVITVGHAEAACGQSEVYGDPCQQACGASTDYAYLTEGVVIRAKLYRVPPLQASFPNLTQVHLRSRIASGYFAWEQQQTPNLISQAGLASVAWCLGAAEAGGVDVPLALLSVGATRFLDAWIVRRERMESPPRRYWMHRMAMRPWNIFLAQVLQFQCQLRDCFQDALNDEGDHDPCREAHATMSDTAGVLAEFLRHYAAVSAALAADPARFPNVDIPALQSDVSRLGEIKSRFETPTPAASGKRMLLQCGLVELPSAGYLPVSPDRVMSVNEQVRNLMGEGVDLRFCKVTPDYVPHALEEAQHMERISLVHGLEKPNDKPRVDVLVPNGEIQPARTAPAGTGYEMTLDLFSPAFRLLAEITNPTSNGDGGGLLGDILRPGGPQFTFRGAARGEESLSGGAAFHFAGAFQPPAIEGPPAFTLIELLRHSAIWISLETERDAFALGQRESLRVIGELLLFVANSIFRLKLLGDLQVLGSQTSASETRVSCRLIGNLEARASGSAVGELGPRVLPISETVVLMRRSGGALPPVVEVILPSPSLLGAARKIVAFRTVRQWTSSTAASVQGALQPPQTLQPAAPSFTVPPLIPLFSASQKVNADVLTPSHSTHALSVTAIRTLGAVLREPDFEELAVRKLFPPPRAISRELIIHAREDWVLFHRRREKQCVQEEPAPIAIAARRYRVYLVELNNVQQRDELDRALKANDGAALRELQPQAVTVSEFAAGIQTLAAPDHLQADWQAHVGKAAKIVYGAVASVGAALDDGVALGTARLGNLTTTLGAVTPLDAAVKLEVLPAVPDASAITAVPYDGIMVVATIPAPTICHEIYRLDSSIQEVDDFVEHIANASGDRVIPDFLPPDRAQRIGQAQFSLEGGDLVATSPDDLAVPWTENGDGDVPHIVVISQRFEEPTEAEQIQRYLDQAKQIAAKIGAKVIDVHHQHPEDTRPIGKCPVITVLFAAPRIRTVCHEVVLHRVAENANIDELVRKIQEGGLGRVAPISPETSFGAVKFSLPGNKPDEPSREKLKEKWLQRFPRPAHAELFIVVSPKGTTAADQKLHLAQTASIKEVTDPDRPVRNVVSGDSAAAPFPSACQAVTLAVFRRVVIE